MKYQLLITCSQRTSVGISVASVVVEFDHKAQADFVVSRPPNLNSPVQYTFMKLYDDVSSPPLGGGYV